MTTSARERGIALLVVLWIIVAGALVVSAFNATVRSGVSFVGSEVQLSKTEALLDAGLEIAAGRLIDEEVERRWVPDGRTYRVAFAGADLAISVRDTNGYIDINKADPRLLMGLLRRFAESEAKAGRLRDRILLARGTPPGAGKSQDQQEAYAEDNPAATPAGNVSAFVDIAQLRLFEGMTAELYAALAPHLTVYSGDGRINARAAPAEVLASIPGLTQSDVENLRASASAPKDKDRELSEAERRAGAFLSDKAGPAYLVTVEVLRKDGGPGTSVAYVVAVGLDPQAPYRLIAKRPVGAGQLSKPN